MACAVLHNIALDRKETIAEDDKDIASDEDNFEKVAVQLRNNNIRQSSIYNDFKSVS